MESLGNTNISFENMQVSDKVRYVAKEVLQQLKASDENPIIASIIYNEFNRLVQEGVFDFEIKENTFKAYLSAASSEPTSGINRKEGSNGYYYEDPIDKKTIEEDFGVEQAESQNLSNEGMIRKGAKRTQEKEMYPLLVAWLNDRKYISRDISSLRKNGIWGNPDVLGIKYIDFFGNNHIELTSIEAKITIERWEQNIFEAVSHTMFANRVYFAFLCDQKRLKEVVPEMIPYAQKFGIGLLAIVVDEGYSDKPSELENSDYKFVEVLPAPFLSASVSSQKKFLNECLHINNLNELFNI